jgi:hypothetical protein
MFGVVANVSTINKKSIAEDVIVETQQLTEAEK